MTDSSSLPLLERAEEAFASGKLETALRCYTGLLEADPTDIYVWYRTALSLARRDEKASAARFLSEACVAFAEEGQLLLALAAVRDLQALDAAAATKRMARIAELYGAGSKRVDPRRKAAPPPPRQQLQELPASLAKADRRVLATIAEEACERALEHSAKAKRGAVLPHHPLLSDVEPSDLIELLPLLELKVLETGSVVLEQGSEGTSLYIVVRGVAEVTRDGVHLAHLRSGSFFGEMALLTSSPRTASVTALAPLLVFELGREALQELAAASAGFARVLADYTRRRLLLNLMATSQLFQPLDGKRRAALMELFSSQVYPAGSTVLAEGNVAEGLYVVLSGEVAVDKADDGESLTLASLGAGQVFGEISLIQSRSATASIKALRKTVVLCLSREVFNEHVGEFPEVLAHVYKLAQQREQDTRQIGEREVLAIDDEQSLLI